MRHEGRLKAWNDARGFGFIEAESRDAPVFVHIKAFGPEAPHPQTGMALSFEIEAGPRGPRARRVRPRRGVADPSALHDASHAAGARRDRDRARHLEPPAPWGLAARLALPGFAAVGLAVQALWQPPLAWLGLYAGLSLACFLAYARDKSAARNGRWRTSEGTLHGLALAGGWPGALLAQQLLRHKSRKRGFRAVFWVTVVLNVAAFLLLASPQGRAWLHGL